MKKPKKKVFFFVCFAFVILCWPRPDLFVGFEDVATEVVAGGVTRDVTEHLQVLRVVRHVEYPAKRNQIFVIIGKKPVRFSKTQ